MRARFRPLRLASPPRRALLLIGGPLMWLIALLVVSWVFDHRDSIEIGLVVCAISFVVWIPLLLVARRVRLREERRGLG